MEFRQQVQVKVYIALALAASIVTTAFGVLSNAPGAHAAQSVPYLVNFQGRLTDNAGNILTDGQYNIRFRIFDDISAGTNRWQADRIRGVADRRVTVTNGLFNIQFGDTTLGDPALSPALFDTQTYPNLYLEVELPTPATATCSTNGCASWLEGPMSPRQALASTPYAFNADRIDGIDGSSLVQLSPSSQQTGAINISGSVQSASLQVTGAVQGASATYTGASSLTLGTAGPAGNTGAILFNNASNTNTLTLQSGATGGNFAITLPTALTATGDCLKDTTGAGVLGFASCSAGVTLQTVYDNSTSPAQITTSAAAKDLVVKSGAGFNSLTAFQVIPDGTTTPAFNVDTQNGRVGVGIAAPTEVLDVAGAIRVGTTANANAGAIRWNGTDFQGYDGSNWLALSNSGLVQTTPTVAKRKSSVDTSLASTTAFTTESDLSFDVGAGEDWAFHYYVQASVAAAPDIKFRINSPAGSTCTWAFQNIEDAVSTANNGCNVSVTQTIATAGPLNDGIELVGSITNPTTAGTVSLDWAPNVSSATATIFRRGSSMTAVRASGTNTPFQAFINGGNSFTGTAQLGTNNLQDLAILTNGVERLRVDTAGNLKLAATPTASATAALLELDAAIAGGSANGTFIGANPTGFTGDFINLQVGGSSKYVLNAMGDQTAGMTQLDGSTTTSGTGTNSTSMTVASSANFNIGNYIQLANTAACQTGGPTTCYSKITNIVGNVLTITPALNWANARPIVEYHVPEIGGTNTAQPLATRYGRGYFISGVATGNGTTYYNEDGIDTTLTDYSIVPTATSLSVGGAATAVAIPGSLSVAGQAIVDGTGQINGAQLQTGTVANGALANNTIGITAGTGLSGGGTPALGGTTSLSVVYGSTATSAVRGDTTVVCPSGAGNLSGGGTTITLGSGGTCGNITDSATPTYTSVSADTFSGSGAVSVASGGTSALTLNSLSGNLVMGANTSSIQKTGAAFSLDVANGASASTLTVTNSGAGVASLSVEGGLTIGSGSAITVGASTGQSSTVSCGANQAVTAAVFTGGVLTTAPTCSAISGTGATTTLNNLGTTSINADLLPGANNTRSIGSAGLVWQNMYAGNIDAGTTTTAMTIGTAATTTAVTIGRSGLQVSIPGGVSSSGNLTTSGNISTTGSGTITSAGAISGPTSTNTINGLVVNSGSLSSVTGYTQTSGTVSQTYSTATAGTAHTINVTNTNTGAGIAVQGISLVPTNTATASSGTNVMNVVNFAAGGALGGTDQTNGLNFASATGYTNFINTPTAVLTSAGAWSGLTGVALTSGNISTPGNISTTGSGTITSAGAISAPTATNTINGLIINTGTLSGITGLTVASGNVTVNQAAGNQLTVTSNAVVPTADQIVLTNTGSSGVATTDINILTLQFKGGNVAVESSAQRIELQPGTTTGGVWSGSRTVHNATGPATGVTTNGAKYDGPTVGGAGTYNALNIGAAAVTTGGTVRGINITGANSSAAGTIQGININNITGGAGASENAVVLGTGWDNLLTYNGGTLISGTGVFTGNGSGLTNLDPTDLAQGSGAVTLQSAAATAVSITSNAASTWQTTSGALNITGNGGASISTGGANNISLTPGTTGQVVIGGTTPTITSTGSLALDSNTTGALNIGTGANAKTITIGNTTAGTRLTLQAAVNTTTSGNNGVGIGSATTDTNQVNLQLDSFSTFGETASTCSTTVNQGALYYNTNTNAIRGCVGGAWEDVMTTAGLGIIMYGVVPDSGTNPGDLPSLVTAGVSGPCKVSWTSATQVTVAPCIVFSGGRKNIVPSTALTLTTTTANRWENVCISTTTGLPVMVGPGASQTAAGIMPTFNASAPVVCLATIQNGTATNGSFTTGGQIYDVRPFTTSIKEFVTASTAVGLGYIAQASTTNVVPSTATLGTAGQRGVVVASNGATSTTAPNAIIATHGPAYVKAVGGTSGAAVVAGATSGFANTSATTTFTMYAYLGMSRTTYNATCTSAATCLGSLYVDLTLR